MIIWVIIALLYALGIVICYSVLSKKDNGNTKFDNIWLSVFWICLLPLFIIHIIHNGSNPK